MVETLLRWSVTGTVRVPEPVYERIERQSERQDVARGVIVKEWMEMADKYQQLEVQ